MTFTKNMISRLQPNRKRQIAIVLKIDYEHFFFYISDCLWLDKRNRKANNWIESVLLIFQTEFITNALENTSMVLLNLVRFDSFISWTIFYECFILLFLACVSVSVYIWTHIKAYLYVNWKACAPLVHCGIHLFSDTLSHDNQSNERTIHLFQLMRVFIIHV